MAIQHNVYEDGKVQSLGFKTAAEQDATVGVLERGDYNFGEAKRREVIQVITGQIISKKGEKYDGGIVTVLVFERGEIIEFSCTCATAYFCLYG